MMSLFSSFDSFYYLSVFISFTLFFLVFFNNVLTLNPLILCCNNMFSYLFKFFYSSFSFNTKGFVKILMSLFILLFIFNFISVGPFSFAITSQVSCVLSLSLIFWSSLILFCSFHNWKGILSHFIPEGTPMGLTWFIFMIEIVSCAIRPITLFVRLLANVLSGHLLMILLSKMVFIYSSFFIFYFFLNMVEMIVSLIQAFIFCTMISLYYVEI